MSSVLGFEVEYFDEITKLTRQLFLKFFIEDNTLEILGEKKAFLGRVYYPDVTISDLYLGNSITVYSRVLILKKYANSFTEDFMTSHEFKNLLILKGFSNISDVLTIAAECDQTIGRVRGCTTSKPGDSNRIIGYVRSRNNHEDDIVITGDMIIMEVIGRSESLSEKFIGRCMKIGPSVQVAQATSNETAGLFKGIISAGIHIPTNSTLCLVKPHIIRDKQLGDIIKSIQNDGFEISGILSIHLSRSMADELFEDYRAVLRNYNEILAELCKAPVIALMLTGGAQIVDNFREYVGPQNPTLAKTVRPHSLRATFGVDAVMNAVHCTDLAEDGQMECSYFFKTIANL